MKMILKMVKKVKKLNLADNGFVSVIFKKEYANKITLEMQSNSNFTE